MKRTTRILLTILAAIAFVACVALVLALTLC